MLTAGLERPNCQAGFVTHVPPVMSQRGGTSHGLFRNPWGKWTARRTKQAGVFPRQVRATDFVGLGT
jgi:hypothetical protein